ncbi:GAF domain-containing protein [Pantanalinema rosaneae CENA516]|uniref:sensor histidine kinase n=1 Tax=Pantanalinema rosaneae TaxID=1620701 RepID=UPI003D6EC2E6
MSSQSICYHDQDKSKEELCAELGELRRQVSQFNNLRTLRPPSHPSKKRSLLDAQNQVLELIATGTPLPKILAVLAQRIEEQTTNALCSILLLDDTGQTLYLGAAPSFPDSYQQLLAHGIPVGACAGTCGTAVYRREPVTSVDVTDDPLWAAFREIPLSYGFRAYWSSPIFASNGDVLGTFAMVYRMPRYPSQHDRHLVELSTHLAGIAIERERSDMALKASEEQLRSLNARLEQQVQERTAQLQRSLEHEALLKRITDKVRDSLDEAQILQVAVEELGQVLGVFACEAGIYNAEQATRTVRYEYTILPLSTLGTTTKVCDLPMGAFCAIAPEPPCAINASKAVFACPIWDNHDTIGDLWLFKSGHESFDELEIRLVQQVANQCAIALRQARLYQAAQAQVTELEKLNQMKDEFLSTVSHELRTPIANMKMAIHMLKLSTNTEQRQRYLEILQSQCLREAELINDLLDLQRLEASSYVIALDDEVNLSTWIPAVVKPFDLRTQEQQQLLQVVHSPILAPILTHRASLERVLSELLNNACKYTPAQGQIELQVEQTTGVELDSPPEVIFTVRNQAEIPATELSHIFDKFYRVPNADPWRRGGTGLGLALVQKLVERLGGTIRVLSQQGWTLFEVRLPWTAIDQSWVGLSGATTSPST